MNPDEISENDFRYPGPKPQFKEAAIMMIADSLRSGGAFALSEPTPENIRFIVTKIIDAILQDDQLDECDLTLARTDADPRIDDQIARRDLSFARRLSGLHAADFAPENSHSRRHRLRRTRNALRKPSGNSDPPGGEVEDEAIDRSREPNRAEAKTVK